ERLHGRRGALGRAGRPRGARRDVRRVTLVTLLATLAAAAPAGARARWDTRVLALVPSPGFPALAYVHPNGRIYEGTYDNPPGGQRPRPDYAAWGPDGSLYVTDYQQAVIWRVPPGGGDAKVWLSDPRLDGGMFGTAGIALAADHRTLVVAQASSAGGGEPDPTTGKLYAVPIQPDGGPGPI